MKGLLAVIAVLLLAVVLAVAFAPASLVTTALTELDNRGLMPPDAARIQLNDTSGTLWRGKAQQASIEYDGGTLDLGTLTWELSPTALLDRLAKVQLYTEAPNQRLQGLVTVNELGLITIDDIEGRLPIGIFEPWVPILVNGSMAFVVDQLQFNPRQLLAIDGVLNLEELEWMGADDGMPLGSYMAQISLQANDIHVQINDFGALLGAEGLLTVNPSGRYNLDATLMPRPGLAPEVIESLGWVGRRDANGDVQIKKRGRF